MGQDDNYVHLTRPLCLQREGRELPGDEIRRGAPSIDARDIGVIRGFGAFEVVHGFGNRLLGYEAHMRRLERSLDQLGMPPLNVDSWHRATKEILRGQAATENEFALRYVVTGGGEVPSCGWIHRTESPKSLTKDRLIPRSAMLLDRGVSAEGGGERPWLLHGVKSLSYGGNLLGERLATQRGYDDSIFVTSDGNLLEGTTSSLVWLREGALMTTEHALGVLPGTTQGALFDVAHTLGLRAEFGQLHLSELGLIDGAWLMSAMRLATAIRSIEQHQLSVEMDLTAKMNDGLFAAMREVR